MKTYKLAVVMAIFAVVAVWIACLMPTHASGGFQYTDKFQHAGAYLVQVLAMAILFPDHRGKILGWFLFQGALIEGLQSLTSYRSAEFADMAANSVGIALGLALSFTPAALRIGTWVRGRQA